VQQWLHQRGLRRIDQHERVDLADLERVHGRRPGALRERRIFGRQAARRHEILDQAGVEIGADTLALELRQPLDRFRIAVEDPDRIECDTTERSHSGSLFAVNDAAEDECGIDAGLRVFQKRQVIDRAVGVAQVQRDVLPGEFVTIITSEVIEGAVAEARRHSDRRGRRGDEVPQQQPSRRDHAKQHHDGGQRGSSLQSQHGCIPALQGPVETILGTGIAFKAPSRYQSFT
jgi:hypothetical protein